MIPDCAYDGCRGCGLCNPTISTATHDAKVAKLERRIAELEAALRGVLSGSDDGVMCTSIPHPGALAHASKILGDK